MLDSGGVRVRLVTGSANDVRWRLLAGNGRVLAVSSDGFADAAGAEAALVRLVSSADELAASIRHPASSVAWSWTALDSAGAAVAAGERAYARYGTCASSFARFRATVTRLDGADVRALFRLLER